MYSLQCICCVLKNAGLDTDNWGGNMWYRIGHCLLFCYPILHFSSFPFILHASAHFCTATVEAIEADKGMLSVIRGLFGWGLNVLCGFDPVFTCTTRDGSLYWSVLPPFFVLPDELPILFLICGMVYRVTWICLYFTRTFSVCSMFCVCAVEGKIRYF